MIELHWLIVAALIVSAFFFGWGLAVKHTVRRLFDVGRVTPKESE